MSRLELAGTVFGTGAAVMLVEILGTRIIGPIFGVSLFVWSALLAVTLASLAGGYYVGGVLVDRSPHPRLLGTVVLAAGVALGIVPLMRHVVLRYAADLGPRAGALVSAALLFTPTLLLLGMVGPIVVRLIAVDFRTAGRGVGTIYAVSTAGSLVGTLLCGFVIIPIFETDQILAGTAVLLVIIGAVPLLKRGKAGAMAALLVPPLALALPSPALPAGYEIVDQSQSLYGLVQVIDDHERRVRFLRADHSIIGAQYVHDHTAAFSFLHLLEAIQYLRPEARDMLQIGLGIGSLPSVLETRGIKADAVEIDPAVVRMAREHFRYAPRGDVYVEDARTFLRRTQKRYDLIVHDTFTGGTTPEHLLSLEVIERIRDVLKPEGVLALNYVGYQIGPNAEATFAVARTLKAIFPNVRAFRDGPPSEHPEESANFIFFASTGPLVFQRSAVIQYENRICEGILHSFEMWEVFQDVPAGVVITDERNPLARLQLAVSSEHFAAMNELIPLDVWLR